ncbi:MAG: tetratricopeptide repeat protein, partial [Gemmataceae bacterium]
MWQTIKSWAGRHSRLRTLLVAVVVLAGLAGSVHAFGMYRWNQARSALSQGKGAEAYERIAPCLRIWPWSVSTQLFGARTARVAGHPEESEALLKKCLRLHHGASPEIQLEFLLLRVQMGEVDDVAGILTQMVDEGHPESQMILETLAGAYMHNLRYRPALAVLNRWIRFDPDAAKAYEWRGWVYDRMNYPKDSLQDFLKALELDPNMIPARLRAAEIYMERSNPPEAEPHLEYLVKNFPERADARGRLGQCRVLQGRDDEARGLLEQAVEGAPNDPLILIYLAKLDIRQGRPERAEKWLRRLLEIDGSDIEARYNLFNALQLQGRKEEATTTLEEYERYKKAMEKANH